MKSDQKAHDADRQSFGRLLSDLSLRLLKIDPLGIDNEIRRSLRKIGKHYRVDRVALRKFSQDQSRAELPFWWTRGDNADLVSSLPTDEIPWASGQMLRDVAIRINRLDDLPPIAAAERALLERIGLSAALLVPLLVDEQCFGCLILGSEKDRTWSQADQDEAQQLGIALAVSYVRASRYNNLWASEERLRAVLDNQTEFIVRWLPDGTRTWVNDRYCEFFDQSRESIIGTSFLPLVAPAYRQKILEGIAAISEENPTHLTEHEVLQPDGQTGWQQWADTGIFDASGNLVEIQSVGRDITDRKLAEKAQVESEDRYSSLIDNSADWIWEMGLDLKHNFSNPQLEAILGYTADELEQLSLRELMHPDDLIDVEEQLPKLMEKRSGWDRWVIRFQHKDGGYRHLQSSANPIFDADGELCGYRGIDRDVTDLVASSDLVAENERKYRRLFESANDAIMIVDGDYITDCNSKALEMFGREREEILGKRPWDVELSASIQRDGQRSEELGPAILAEAYAGKPQRFEWLHARRDGAPFHMEVSITYVDRVDGRQRLMAVARDISDAKAAQQEIERRARFQARLATMSAALLKCTPEEIIDHCRSELEKIAREFGIDGAAIWSYPTDRKTINRVVAWRRDDLGVPPAPDTLSLADSGWTRQLLFDGDTIVIDDVANLPDEPGSPRALLQNIGIGSVLAFSEPLKDVPWGACACVFSMIEGRKWSGMEILELQLLGLPLANALTRNLAIKELEHRANFQRRLAELSTKLSTAPAEETNFWVVDALERIGVDYELDNIFLWWISGESGEMRRHAGWRRSQDVHEIPLRISASDVIPWSSGQVLGGETVRIDDVDDLPDVAGIDKKLWQERGYRSILAFPVKVEETTSGVFFISVNQKREWRGETVQELQLLADTVSGAAIRFWASEELRKNKEDLLRSQEVARVGSFSLTYETPQTEFTLHGDSAVTDQFREIFGLDNEPDPLATSISRIHPEDRKRVVQTAIDAFESCEPIHQTFRVVRPDGSEFVVEDRSEFIRDEQGHATRWFGTVQDVTAQVESRSKIEHALAEIEKLKDQLQEENLFLRQEIRTSQGFDKIIGKSTQLRNSLNSAAKVAPTDIPVLILGETGTGKELVAQAIHDLSDRKDHPIVSVNCAALSAELIESELFGHEKGSFTGAHAKRKGRFELADGGTLFLDEIGELQGEQQAKLLRVLQTGEFERLGGSETLHVDARLIAATNKDLKKAVDRGEFRADLYYRICSFPIEMPPLRERPEDIPALAEYFVQLHAKRMGKDIQSVSARTLRYMADQQWPGNVRELEGFVQRALISASGDVLDFSDAQSPAPESVTSPQEEPVSAPADLRAAERQHITKVLNESKWVIDGKNGAAAMMGVAPSTLRSKMKRLGIERPA